ncbi:MAG: hypothetical protein ACK41Q_13175 [Candidatus Brocadia sp.]
MLITNLYETIFHDGQYGLGAATTAAKIATYAQGSFWGEMVETFVLFGDPATQLGVAGGSIEVIAPRGGEVITSESTFTIQWTAPQSMVKFNLAYSLDNGHSWEKIAKNVEGTSYDWDVPDVNRTKEKCLIKLTGFDAFGKKRGKGRSDSTFTIERGGS